MTFPSSTGVPPFPTPPFIIPPGFDRCPPPILPLQEEQKLENGNTNRVFTLFIGQIADNVSNACMEVILKKCGSLVRWMRIVGTSGRYQAFGFCDFADELSTLRALRILNGFKLGENNLVVQAEEKLRNELLNWQKETRKAAGKPEVVVEDGELPAHEDETKEDAEIRAAIINWLDENHRELRTCSTRKSRSPKRSSSRQRRKSSSSSSLSSNGSRSSSLSSHAYYEKQEMRRIYKQKQRRYNDRVERWERREKKQEHYYAKLEKKNQKNYQQREIEKLRTFLANYDDSKQDSRWYKGYEGDSRRKFYEKEKRLDEEDRLDELQEIEELNRIAEEEANISKETEKVSPYNVSGASISTIINADIDHWTTQEHSDFLPSSDPIAKPFQTLARKSRTHSLSEKLKNVFGGNEDEDVDVLRTRKRLKPFEISKEERIAHMTEEEKKRMLKDLIQKLPKEKTELFAIPVDRSQIDDAWLERRVRPWVSKRISEFIGEEEKSFTTFICEKIANESDPYKVMNDIKMILDEDAEVFMIKLWRLILFETEAKKYGLPLTTI